VSSPEKSAQMEANQPIQINQPVHLNENRTPTSYRKWNQGKIQLKILI